MCLTDSSSTWCHQMPPSASGASDSAPDASEGAVDLTAALGVVPFAHQLQVDGKVAALGPAGPFGDQQPASRHHQDELGSVLVNEQRGQQPTHRA